MKSALIIAIGAGGLLLSGCSTLSNYLPQVSVKDSPATQETKFAASDLLDAVDGQMDRDMPLAIVTKESSGWGVVEDELRLRGFSVSTVRRSKDVETETPVTFNVEEDADLNLHYGSLTVGDKIEASRFYETIGDKVYTASPMTRRTPLGFKNGEVIIYDVDALAQEETEEVTP